MEQHMTGIIPIGLDQAGELDIAAEYGCVVVRDYKLSSSPLIYDKFAGRFYNFNGKNWTLNFNPRPNKYSLIIDVDNLSITHQNTPQITNDVITLDRIAATAITADRLIFGIVDDSRTSITRRT